MPAGRAVLALVAASVAAAALTGATPSSRLPEAPSSTTFAKAGGEALRTLLGVYYGGNGLWNQCNSPNCAQANSDWGADSLTYALYLRWATSPDSSIPPVMSALTATAPSYPGPCTTPSCGSWSDVPQWDTIADLREYEVTRDPKALAKAEAAFEFAEGSNAYALGACPDIRYQQPNGEINHLKTLETDANAIKAAILLYQATGEGSYLQSATGRYAAVRAHFLDPAVPLYSVYVFDDGTSCTPGAPPVLCLRQRRHDLERARALEAHRRSAPTWTNHLRRPERSPPTSTTRRASSPTCRRRTTSSSRSSRRCTRSRPRTGRRSPEPGS